MADIVVGVTFLTRKPSNRLEIENFRNIFHLLVNDKNNWIPGEDAEPSYYYSGYMHDGRVMVIGFDAYNVRLTTKKRVALRFKYGPRSIPVTGDAYYIREWSIEQ